MEVFYEGAGMHRFTVISGCSGGGKSTLLAELASRGFAIVEEPGRRVVVEETARGGSALPWVDIVAFVRRTFEVAMADYEKASALRGRVFFDRGLVDAAAALDHFGQGERPDAPLRAHRYDRRVFLTPPWPAIYEGDAERRHGFGEAVAEYERLLRFYPALGYDVTILPKASVGERADFVLNVLSDG